MAVEALGALAEEEIHAPSLGGVQRGGVAAPVPIVAALAAHQRAHEGGQGAGEPVRRGRSAEGALEHRPVAGVGRHPGHGRPQAEVHLQRRGDRRDGLPLERVDAPVPEERPAVGQVHQGGRVASPPLTVHPLADRAGVGEGVFLAVQPPVRKPTTIALMEKLMGAK